MMHTLLAGLFVLGLFFAPSDQVCAGGAFHTADMAGWYLSQPNQMALTVTPCGGFMLTWDNQFGRHQAAYRAVQVMEGGGYVATGMGTTDFYLDGQTAIGVVPAEPGLIHIVTVSPYLTDPRVYVLAKMG